MNLQDEVFEVLKVEGPATVPEIAKQMGLDDRCVANAMARLEAQRRAVVVSKQLALRGGRGRIWIKVFEAYDGPPDRIILTRFDDRKLRKTWKIPAPRLPRGKAREVSFAVWRSAA